MLIVFVFDPEFVVLETIFPAESNHMKVQGPGVPFETTVAVPSFIVPLQSAFVELNDGADETKSFTITVFPDEQPAKSVTTTVYDPGDKFVKVFVEEVEFVTVEINVPFSSYH